MVQSFEIVRIEPDYTVTFNFWKDGVIVNTFNYSDREAVLSFAADWDGELWTKSASIASAWGIRLVSTGTVLPVSVIPTPAPLPIEGTTPPEAPDITPYILLATLALILLLARR